MTSPRSKTRLLAATWPWLCALGTVAAVACGAMESSGAGTDGGGAATSGGGGYPEGDASIDVAADAAPSVTPSSYAGLCGLDGPSMEADCVPGGAPEDCAPGGNPGVGGAGGAGEQTLFCQVAYEAGEPVPVCAPVGSAKAFEACSAALGCGAGLACVTTDDGSTLGRCLPYCCGDVEDCPLDSGEAGSPPDTYCVPHPLLDDPVHSVPVCQPVVDCELLLPGACPAGQKCAVVREDGTTSCVPIQGEGELCEACPCAEGYVCHQLTQTCQKICHTSTAYGDECSGGSCLGGSMSFPEGFGVCVGGEATCD